MLSFASTHAGTASDVVGSTGQHSPQSLAEMPSAQEDVVRSHARALGQLMALMKLQAPAQGGDAAADACLCAFVNSRLHMADVLADQSNTAGAAICLAHTHQTLLAIIYQTPLAGTWQKSAIWHSRRLHFALLNHLEEYGHHPAIDDAFRAGCLALSVASGHLH